MKCNLNPTNYINTAALVMWNVAGTHTRNHQFHAHRQSNQSRGEKVGVEGRIKYYGRYIFVIRCDVDWNVV